MSFTMFPPVMPSMSYHMYVVFTQKTQSDIEKHGAGVASVLNLCGVLIHDMDACPSLLEITALEQAMHSLDKRWRNICSLSMSRKQR